MICRVGLRPLSSCLRAAATATLIAAFAGATPALAEIDPVAHWKLESSSAPTNLPLAGEEHNEGVIVITMANLGDSAVNGEAQQVTATDTLPEGLEVTSVKTLAQGSKVSEKLLASEAPGGFACNVVAAPQPRVITCTFAKLLRPYRQLQAYIRVKVDTDTPAEPSDEVTVTGGETKEATLKQKLKINGQAPRFGVEQYEVATEEENGEPAIEAGSHPYQMTTTFALNQQLASDFFTGTAIQRGVPAAGLPERLNFALPSGLIGNPNVGERCTAVDFYAEFLSNENNCSPKSVVGVATVTFNDPSELEYISEVVPVFNLVPSKGEPAQLGFEAEGTPVILNTSLRTGGDYGVTVEAPHIPEGVGLLASRVTIWGVPGEASHDQSRGWGCFGFTEAPACEEHPKTEAPREPFLTLPTECNRPLTTSVSGESWPREDGTAFHIEEGAANTSYRFPLGLDGAPTTLSNCQDLDFSPTMALEAESTSANTPSAMTFHVHLPQQTTLEADGKAEAAVKDTEVVLPAGVLLSPSAANGLEACSEGQTGFTGLAELDKEKEPGQTTPQFSEKLPNPLAPGANFCPNGAKVGAIHIASPDLLKRHGASSTPELEGGVYLASQNANPFGSLFAMYIIAEEPESGVLVKLAGEVKVSASGQITSTFANTPDVPFEDLTLELYGGPDASLSTPPTCGDDPMAASFTPWSGTLAEPKTVPGGAPADEVLHITSGPGGSPCASAPTFAPSFAAGSTNNQAGAFSPFSLSIGVPQPDAGLKTISNLQLPAGVAALLGSVTLCPEPSAAEGSCGETTPDSLIGHSTAASGLGSDPFHLPGSVYLTGPYAGAPFGLSAVTEATAGPFHLGRVVVRSSIAVNPYTAAATINTEAATFIKRDGQEDGRVEKFPGLPEFIDGVPSQIKQLNVTIDRSGFEFNPTNCEPASISATLTGTGGLSEPVSSPFQVSGCAGLPFAPKIKASVGGQGSKANGVNFAVTLESPGLGQANIHKVDLTLPKALPSRLETIQKACKVQIFEVNPASCDEGSVIGEGIVHTPVFKNPLRGPAYLVGHAGEEFPDIEFVLQGENVTIILDGKTFIEHGVTFSKFETAPDAPFTKFESIFPAGPHSALGVDSLITGTARNLCKVPLSIPTEIGAQSGLSIKETTKVAVTGCKGVLGVQESKAAKLKKALKACKKDKKKGKRLACERQARKKYGPKKPARKPAKKTTKKR
jgi:hypothetical protein